MFDFIRKSLGNKIMATVTAGILLIMGVEIFLGVYFGTKDRLELVQALSTDLAASTHSGIKYPMSVGDSNAVERVLADVQMKMAGVEVFICDTDQRIIWSTHANKIHTRIAESIPHAEPLAMLTTTLRTGKAPLASIEDSMANEHYLITIEPILNEKECIHCHGPAKAVIGGMVIRANMQRAMAAVAAARNKSILITLLGLGAILALIYALVEKFIRGPVEGLADGARRVGGGDLNFEITSRANDEIGELAGSFNRMTRELKTARDEISNWTETLEDLVEERTAQLKMAQVSALQAEKMASMGRLAAIVAHEINNPLAGIRTYAKLLLKQDSQILRDNDPRHIDYLRTIESEATRCGEIVRNLLQFARPAKPHFEKLDINTTIQESVQLVQHKFQVLNIALNLNLAEAPIIVNCDEQKIKQALVALLLNGCDAVQQDTGVIEIQSLHLPEKQQVEISIHDNGVGMDDETSTHIFEPFFTTKTRTQEESPGTNIGLGLAVVYEIIKAHQGEISVRSEPRKGTVFTILLPEEPDSGAPS